MKEKKKKVAIENLPENQYDNVQEFQPKINQLKAEV